MYGANTLMPQTMPLSPSALIAPSCSKLYFGIESVITNPSVKTCFIKRK